MKRSAMRHQAYVLFLLFVIVKSWKNVVFFLLSPWKSVRKCLFLPWKSVKISTISP